MKMTASFIVLLMFVLVLPASALVQTCQDDITASTPTARFTLNGDGTATDVVTGLTWKRCAEGQTWDGTTCTGSAATKSWQAALQAGETSAFADQSDWRLPNIKELTSIVETKCVSPNINLDVFPSAVSWDFWSGSPYAGHSDRTWYVSFYVGAADIDAKDFFKYVRLVRGGQ